MYLFMDTTDKRLNIGLFDEHGIVEYYSELSVREQSEKIMPTIEMLLKNNNCSIDDIHKVVITKGPGSYTGVRIAMCVAKVLCSLKKIELYTLSTLQAMCGMDNGVALIDARSQRAFIGCYNNGKAILEDTIMSIEDIKEYLNGKSIKVVGATDLLDLPTTTYNLLENVIALKPHWEHVENVHTLVPAYCKDQDSYGK